MAEQKLKLNRKALEQILTSPQAHAAVLREAEKVCKRANGWADAYPRSGRHPEGDGPHFEVVSEPSAHRARYTIRPCTIFGTWLVLHDPSGLIACMTPRG